VAIEAACACRAQGRWVWRASGRSTVLRSSAQCTHRALQRLSARAILGSLGADGCEVRRW